MVKIIFDSDNGIDHEFEIRDFDFPKSKFFRWEWIVYLGKSTSRL